MFSCADADDVRLKTGQLINIFICNLFVVSNTQFGILFVPAVELVVPILYLNNSHDQELHQGCLP